MGDFGKIFEEWESMKRGSRRDTSVPRDGDWFERQLDRYPVVDKDAEGGEEASTPFSNPQYLPVDDSIDLHGLTVAEALQATEQFLSSCRARGLRKVVVIHGKGRNGEGVLKREVRAYLEHHRQTGAMGYARGPDGGRGALWVVLRNRGT
jgi:dsDNA-specific endonuclease/ATPase MutS2